VAAEPAAQDGKAGGADLALGYQVFAVVQAGGKQYKVTNNDLVTVNYMDAEVGRKIVLEKVLLVGCSQWTAIGTPLLSNNAKVVATVIEHYRGKKIQVFKKKRRKGYARRHGHRQEHTTLRIDEVQYTGADE